MRRTVYSYNAKHFAEFQLKQERSCRQAGRSYCVYIVGSHRKYFHFEQTVQLAAQYDRLRFRISTRSVRRIRLCELILAIHFFAAFCG